MSDVKEILETAATKNIHALLEKAIEQRMEGQFDNVTQTCSRIFHEEEDQPGALYILGTIALNTGDFKQAVVHFRKVLKTCPEWSLAYNNLGNALQSLGNFEQAADNYAKSLSLNSENAEVYNNLANLYQRTGNYVEAIRYYKQALLLKPDYPVILSNLGAAFQACGKLEEAVTIYEKAIKQMPKNFKAHNNLGTVLEDLRRFEEAEKCYRNALALKPDYIEAYTNLGNALHAMGRTEEAISMYYKALELDPKHVRAEHNLAVLYERNNDLDKALEHSQKALNLNPDYYSAQITQSIILKRQGEIEQAKELLNALRDKHLAHKDLGRVYFELGKIYDHQNYVDKAYECFTKANNVRRKFSSGDVTPEKALKDLEHDKSVLNKDFINSWPVYKEDTQELDPIFLVGFPRSGTTLLDQILNAHPKLQVMEEEPALLEVWVSLYNSPQGYPEALASLTQDDIMLLRQKYFAFTNKFINLDPSAVLVDQSPLNICYISLIKRLFPASQIICALRHPCDVVLSCFMQDFKLNNSMANFFSLEEAARFYDKVMGLWLQQVELFELQYHKVKYEDVVKDFEKETKAILEFLNLNWDPCILNYRDHKDERGRISSASYSQVVQPIYDSSCYRWKGYERYFTPVKERLDKYIKAFQYEE